MNYDQHWLTSPPGPIAGQDWFVETSARYSTSFLLRRSSWALANYAYDWSLAAKKEREAAEEFSIQEALLHAESLTLTSNSTAIL